MFITMFLVSFEALQLFAAFNPSCVIPTTNSVRCRMWLNLSKIIARLSHDPDVRVIFITSSGDRAFSAGLDVQVRSASLVTLTLRYPSPNSKHLGSISRYSLTQIYRPSPHCRTIKTPYTRIPKLYYPN